MIFNRSTLVFVCLLLLLILPCFGASEFQVEGSYRIQFKRASNSYDSDDEGPQVFGVFSMTVSNCLWKIRYWQNNLTADYTEVGTDGETILTLRSLVNQTITNAAGKPSMGINKEIGTVDPGPYPNVFNTPIVCVLWWVYASSCYLSTNSDSLFYPIDYPDAIYSAGMYFMGLRFPGTVQRHSRPPNLPTRIVVLDDGFARSWPRADGQSFPDLMTTSRRSPPFEDGYTNSLIVADNFVSVGELNLAKRVQATLFHPAPDAKTRNDTRETATYSITATNLSDKISALAFIPEVSGRIFVTDNRFVRTTRPVHNLGYLTESRWLNDAEVRLRGEYLKRLAIQPVEKKSVLVGISPTAPAGYDRDRR